MPWLRNNNTIMSQDLAELYSSASNTVRYELYRTRNPIDVNLFTFITMPFKLNMVPRQFHNTMNRFRTVAMPRGVTPDEAFETIDQYLATAFATANGSRYVLIVNTDSNQAVTPHVMEQLTDRQWTTHDFRTALTCTPFHQVSVMCTDAGISQTHTVIFTNIITDEFLLKLGAVLPILHGFELPEDIARAYLNCDKQAFCVAFETQLADIIAARRQAEQYMVLTQIEQYLKTSETATLNNNIAIKQRDITQRENTLRDLYAQLKELLIRQASTYWGEADARIAEFIEYIKTYDMNKITRMGFDQGNDRFAVQLVTELAYWDEQAYKNYATSSRNNCVTEQDAPTKALLNNIFLDRTVKVIFHTGIRIFFRQGQVSNYSDYLPAGTSTIGIPHTHIYHHDCWGNNRRPIEKAFANRDYLIAWEQIKATLCGLNIPDTTVFSKFCNIYMATSDTPCLIIKSTGERLSPTAFKRKYPAGWTDITVPEPETSAPRRVRRAVTEEPRHEAETEAEAVEADDDPFL